MKTFKENINYYIKNYDVELLLFEKGVEIKQKGFLTKNEFLNICLWKSRRPKNLYNQNTESDVERITKLALGEIDEIKKIEFLTSLIGVRIPTASAILSVVNPQEYPIIDVRCVKALQELKIIEWEIINYSNWIQYLIIIRRMSSELNLSCREIEKGLFAYNRLCFDNEYKNLYK